MLEKVKMTCKLCSDDVIFEHFDMGNQIGFACLTCKWAERIVPLKRWKCSKCFEEDKR